MDQRFSMTDWVIPFEQLRNTDVAVVGGKNASLGEMISQLPQGVRVPTGFATTAYAFQMFLQQDGLAERIHEQLAALDVDNVKNLTQTGSIIRQMVMDQPFPIALENTITQAFTTLEAGYQGSYAVRSSATAEDLPDASFAGQQETFLNVSGLPNVFHAIKEVFASLYNDRAISYRVHKGFAHHEVSLSAGIQRMVRSDLGAAGVMFTLDTESGFEEVVLITSSYGLGEMVVQGAVNPDEFYVHKPLLQQGYPAIVRKHLGSKRQKMIFGTPRVETVDVLPSDAGRYSLSDEAILTLARYALVIEAHYGRPMDIEWGQDGLDGQIYILQARPETVKSQAKAQIEQRYSLKDPSNKGTPLVSGRAIGQKIGQGRVRLVDVEQMDQVQQGDVLVTDMTDPNWEPVMKRASAIVTNRGGRTCHAAIIARELGIPAVVGCGHATKILKQNQEVTVSCAEGDTGFIYEGNLPITIQAIQRDPLPDLDIKMMMNVGNPQLAFDFAQIPNAGVGLARLEFIINHNIGIHPKAILDYPQVAPSLAKHIEQASMGHANPQAFFVDKVAEGVATIAAAFWSKPVIVRLSDFKSNEYRKLLGGEHYEPIEENPMLGFRGAARYVSDDFAPAFALECQALKRVREVMGLTNVQIMVPFVRTLKQAERVIDLLAQHGLKRGEHDLKIIMMCEVPSNALLASEFLRYFDGFSIGSNDLTQLTLGLDRDSGLALLAEDFDERDPAVKALLRMAIRACRDANKYIGICGQGPSDHLDFAQWLREEGILSLSLNEDAVLSTWQKLAASYK